MRTFVLIAGLSLAASCPNACNGHGICGAQQKCSCHQNWQGPDCSQKTCPFTLAWADTADGTNQAHYYAECGNKGKCDRKTGECDCFEGYEGKGCRRSTCPNGCNGHGTCELIEEMAGDFADRRNGPGHKYKDLTCSNQQDNDPGTGTESSCTMGVSYATNVVARTANSDKYHGHLYQLWDAGKIQVCKCDLGYKGYDCSSREIPRGDDPSTTVKSVTQAQFVQIQMGGNHVDGDQFFMKFHDPYGGIWITDTIATVDRGTNAGDEVVAMKVQQQLRSLPNGVLSDVDVEHADDTDADQQTCHRRYDGVQHLDASTGKTNYCNSYSPEFLTSSHTKIDLIVNMGDKPGQTGVQYLLEVHTGSTDEGSFPVSSGIWNGVMVTVAEINYNDNLGNLSELAECSDRGIDDGEGGCECFEGFRGLACEEQEQVY